MGIKKRLLRLLDYLRSQNYPLRQSATLVKKAAEKSNTFQQLSPYVLRINQYADTVNPFFLKLTKFTKVFSIAVRRMRWVGLFWRKYEKTESA